MFYGFHNDSVITGNASKHAMLSDPTDTTSDDETDLSDVCNVVTRSVLVSS